VRRRAKESCGEGVAVGRWARPARCGAGGDNGEFGAGLDCGAGRMGVVGDVYTAGAAELRGDGSRPGVVVAFRRADRK
jgi:hypothetical protein